jgi:hypothetical protein
LIYTTIAALAPVVLNLVRKFLGDTTTVAKLLLLGAVLTLGMPGVASAAEVAALPAWFPQLDMTSWIAIAGVVVLGFINKDKLSTILRKLADILDKPAPSPSPAPGPSPTPAPGPAPTLAELISLLINQLFQFRAAGNAEGEAKVKALLDEALKSK